MEVWDITDCCDIGFEGSGGWLGPAPRHAATSGVFYSRLDPSKHVQQYTSAFYLCSIMSITARSPCELTCRPPPPGLFFFVMMILFW